MSQLQKPLKVILIGDTCIDEYHYGNINRLSPEAPVPVFVPSRIERKNGMAANVEENLKKLGVEVISYFGNSSIKTRLIDEKSKQHVVRIDNDNYSDPLSISTQFPDDIDAFVVSDYNKGFVSYELVEQTIKTGVPVFIDTKKTDLKRFDGAYVKINEKEYSAAVSTPTNKLVVTLGNNGAKIGELTEPAPKVEIADVCGAGDTFLASFVYSMLRTNDETESLKFAIKAASVTVKHIGVYAPSIEEIECD